MLNQANVAVQLMISKITESAGKIPMRDRGENLKPYLWPDVGQCFRDCASTGRVAKSVPGDIEDNRVRHDVLAGSVVRTEDRSQVSSTICHVTNGISSMSVRN